MSREVWVVDAARTPIGRHGGALATNMSIYPNHNRALIYLVQHVAFTGDGENIMWKFHEAARIRPRHKSPWNSFSAS